MTSFVEGLRSAKKLVGFFRSLYNEGHSLETEQLIINIIKPAPKYAMNDYTHALTSLPTMNRILLQNFGPLPFFSQMHLYTIKSQVKWYSVKGATFALSQLKMPYHNFIYVMSHIATFTHTNKHTYVHDKNEIK